jgi:hypothetical protein
MDILDSPRACAPGADRAVWYVEDAGSAPPSPEDVPGRARWAPRHPVATTLDAL